MARKTGVQENRGYTQTDDFITLGDHEVDAGSLGQLVAVLEGELPRAAGGADVRLWIVAADLIVGDDNQPVLRLFEGCADN